MTSSCLLVGDIGGTSARFALADGSVPGFSRQKELCCADFATSEHAIRAYLNEVDIAHVEAIYLAVAGSVSSESVDVTNNHWSFEVATLRSEFGTTSIKLMNDFEAIAYAIPLLCEADLTPIGTPVGRDLKQSDFNVAIVGPGTGLGAAGLCKRGDTLFPIVGEVGHVGFAPVTEMQWQVAREMSKTSGRASVERLVSGPGLEEIYEVLTRIRKEESSEMSCADIFAAAADKSDSCAKEAVHLFFEALGQVAGDAALTFGAVDGIFIAGGIAPRYPEMLAASDFRRGFENKGRRRALLEKIPTQLVMHRQPGLLGASYCAMGMTNAKS